jgi:hypothetical protein
MTEYWWWLNYYIHGKLLNREYREIKSTSTVMFSTFTVHLTMHIQFCLFIPPYWKIEGMHVVFDLSIRLSGFFLAHLSWKLKWAFLITGCPSSVYLSIRLSVCKLLHFRLLLQNHWTNFNQTWYKSSLGGGGDSSLFKGRG